MTGKLSQLVAANSVVIFSWVTCPYCAKAKALLGDMTKDLAIYDIDQMPEARRVAQRNHPSDEARNRARDLHQRAVHRRRLRRRRAPQAGKARGDDQVIDLS